MNVKEYLSQIRDKEVRIEDQKQYILMLQESLTSISCVTDAERVKSSSGNDKMVNLVSKVVDAQKELSRMEEEFCVFRIQVIEQIHSMDDIRLKKVLLMKYIYWEKYKTISEIAEHLGYSERHTQRLMEEAVFQFGLKLAQCVT